MQLKTYKNELVDSYANHKFAANQVCMLAMPVTLVGLFQLPIFALEIFANFAWVCVAAVTYSSSWYALMNNLS